LSIRPLPGEAEGVEASAPLEKDRMDAMSHAVKTAKPALEAFYATLSDEQKANLDSALHRRRFWRWRDRW